MGLNRKLLPLLTLYQENRATLDAMTSADAAAWMNAEQDEPRMVSMSEVHDWATSKRLPKRFSDAGKLDSPLYVELRTMITGKQNAVNFASGSAAGIIADLVIEGILSVEEAQEVQALAITKRTRAAQVGINRAVTLEWIERIREVA